jgi:hypothetical protein
LCLSSRVSEYGRVVVHFEELRLQIAIQQDVATHQLKSAQLSLQFALATSDHLCE